MTNEQKLAAVHGKLADALSILITIPIDQDVTSLFSDSIYSTLKSLSLILETRAKRPEPRSASDEEREIDLAEAQYTAEYEEAQEHYYRQLESDNEVPFC